MSELIQKNDNRATIRWKLLTGTSALVLSFVATSAAKAEDSGHTVLWLELSGDAEMLQGTSATFSAPFFTYPTSLPGTGTPLDTIYDASKATVYGSESFSQKQAPPHFAIGGDAKLIFQPEDSDWIFSAGIRYGRSHNKKHTHYQTSHLLTPGGHASTYAAGEYAAAFSDSLSQHSERHSILDFQAGKDIGLGLFGHDGTSAISAGVRFASFTASSGVHISARPYIHFTGGGLKYNGFFHQYFLTGHQERSFRGVGPSISWTASAALAGNPDHGELMLDWGIDGALLFGHQKAKVDHHTRARYHGTKYNDLYSNGANDPLRSRNVTVPELSGFVGLSAKLPNSKISIGYKGDIWFGAMDTGIDAAKKSNLTFNGPFASISIGVGD